MKKRFARVLPLVLLLCACTRAGEAPALDFPQTQWEMNAQGVMDAWGVTPDEVQNYSAEGRAVSFTLAGCTVFGAQAESVTFSFINLALDESGDIQQFDEAAMAGEEVLAGITVQYPQGTDTEKLAAALKAQYGEPLPELTLYPLYNALGAGMAAEEKQASGTQQLWGGATVESQLSGQDAAFFRQNWPVYLPGMETEQDWEQFSQNGRMVTLVADLNETAPLLQFDAYNLAVYRQLAARLGGENTAA